MKTLFGLIGIVVGLPVIAAELPPVVGGTSPVETSQYIDGLISVLDTDGFLAETQFSSFVDRLGVKLATVSAFCLEDGQQRAWVVPSQPDAEGNVFVETFAVQASSDHDQLCFQQEALEASINSKLPGIGATGQAIATLFGGEVGEGISTYSYTTMLGDEGYNWLLATTLSYELRDGLVQGLALSRRNLDSPTGLSRFKYWSSTFIADQIDVRTFASSLGPRIEQEKQTLSDYGFSDSYRRGPTSEFVHDDRDWMFAFTLLEATDERLVLCILDTALEGGTYHSQRQIAFEQGDEGLLVSTGEVHGLPGCEPTDP